MEHEGLLTDNTSTKNILGIDIWCIILWICAAVNPTVIRFFSKSSFSYSLCTTPAEWTLWLLETSIQKQVNAHNQQIDSINQANQANAATNNQQINEIQTTATTTRGTVANAQNQEGVLENITSSTSDHEAIGISNNFTH